MFLAQRELTVTESIALEKDHVVPPVPTWRPWPAHALRRRDQVAGRTTRQDVRDATHASIGRSTQRACACVSAKNAVHRIIGRLGTGRDEKSTVATP